MGILGGLLGTIAGGLGEKFLPIKGVNGAQVGAGLGSLLPFKTGGAVGKRNVRALLHANEYVLPANAKPTKAQKAIVARNKRNAKKK
jgi:hypothetical protein